MNDVSLAAFSTDDHPETRHLKHLVRAMTQFPQVRWADAVSDGQMGSKHWLVDHLESLGRPLGTVAVLGGWVGFLPLILLARVPQLCTRVVTVDLDETVCRAADLLLRRHVMDDLRAFAACADATALSLGDRTALQRIREDGSRQALTLRCDTVINTSWEHFEDPAAWYRGLPRGRLVCIQASTVPDLDDHKSCPADLDALCDMTPMTERLSATAMPHVTGQRLMTIGVV